MGVWNCIGWNSRNKQFTQIRENILDKLNLDILCLVEIHLWRRDFISSQNYNWIGHNRTDLSPRARRGSGGVGVLIKKSLCSNFDVKVLDNTQSDIFWIKLSSKNNMDLLFLICCCYLPAENSTRDNSSQQFFDSLTAQVYSYSDHPLLICGDFNCRIGEKQDVALDYVP